MTSSRSLVKCKYQSNITTEDKKMSDENSTIDEDAEAYHAWLDIVGERYEGQEIPEDFTF